MTLYTETDEHGTEFLVSSAGNQDFRLQINDHERQELQRIADDLVPDDGPQEGDLGTFVDTDGSEHNAAITKVWDANTVNLAYAVDGGGMQEATSVTLDTETYSFVPGGW
jgi:hypothetical protein